MSWAFLGTRRKESIPLNIGINLNPKKCGPDATLESVQTLELADITKRVAVSVIYSIFDPLGLIAPLTIKYKLLLKEFNKVLNLEWSDSVPAELALQFNKLLEEMLPWIFYIFTDLSNRLTRWEVQFGLPVGMEKSRHLEQVSMLSTKLSLQSRILKFKTKSVS